MKISEIITIAECRKPERLELMDSLYSPLKTVVVSTVAMRNELDDAIDWWCSTHNVPKEIRNTITNRNCLSFSEETRIELSKALDHINKQLQVDDSASESVGMNLIGAMIGRNLSNVKVISQDEHKELMKVLLGKDVSDSERTHIKRKLNNSLTEAESNKHMFTMLRIKQDVRQNNNRQRSKLISERNALKRALRQDVSNDYLKLVIELASLFAIEKFLTNESGDTRFRALIDSYFENVDEWIYTNIEKVTKHNFELPKLKATKNASEERAKALLIRDFYKKEIAYIRESLVNIFVRSAKSLLHQIDKAVNLNGYTFINARIDDYSFDRLLKGHAVILQIYGDVRIMCYNFDRGVASWE